ncbi:copper chaperone PCu(A)C [Piscirickettsia litoralis]|uniref:Copper chaperone PCu(A)C n=1 Tax=Piscirickettsia litoralis TaxID=1891921 RepID=A0ABX3A5M3_9GAMM|nr:copper chaperone PCu(A)C [Piscirickettsia litoralis]ODN43522.1 hypothetical protein BGC07_12090 [Piscirickettsia litoralis]
MLKTLNKAIILSTSLAFALTSFATSKDYQVALKQEGQVAAKVVTVEKVRIANQNLKVHDNVAVTALISNNSDQSHEIISAYSPVAEIIQLHKTDGAIMKQLNNITLAPHETLALNQNKDHIMLINLKKDLTNKEPVPLFIEFKDGSWLKTIIT